MSLSYCIVLYHYTKTAVVYIHDCHWITKSLKSACLPLCCLWHCQSQHPNHPPLLLVSCSWLVFN